MAARNGVEIILASPYVRFSQSGETADSTGKIVVYYIDSVALVNPAGLAS